MTEMTIKFKVKSGTGGYFDYGACDLILFKAVLNVVPRIGEKISLLENNDTEKTNSYGEILKELHEYLVTDVIYDLDEQYDNGCEITVYVVPIGRSLNIK